MAYKVDGLTNVVIEIPSEFQLELINIFNRSVHSGRENKLSYDIKVNISLLKLQFRHDKIRFSIFDTDTTEQSQLYPTIKSKRFAETDIERLKAILQESFSRHTFESAEQERALKAHFEGKLKDLT